MSKGLFESRPSLFSIVNAVRHHSIQIIVISGFLGAFAVSASAQDLMPCDACHEVTVSSPPHREFECTACHSNILETPHQDDPLGELTGLELCSQCHSDVAETVLESTHDGLLECTTCHGHAHELLPPTDLNSPTSPVKQIRVCGECHDDGTLLDAYVHSVHGRGLIVSGLINSPSCSDCHGSHLIFPVSEPRATVSRQNIPETCGKCHEILLDQWRNSAHGQAWAEGREDGPVCSTCHGSHTVDEPWAGPLRLKFPGNCGSCHAAAYRTYRDSFHGKVSQLGMVAAATCSDCHTPHLNLSAADPASTVHPTQLEATCGNCHQRTNASFLSFDPHLDPSNPEDSPNVYAVWLVMTTLLICVFGFFGIHDLLWLQRSVVAYLRGETHAVSMREGPYIRRFSTAEIWTHITIVTTFILLAATGLPIKFHYTNWAEGISTLFGGIDVARYIHRLAAILTFGYGAFHLFQIGTKVLKEKDYGILWGWRSMVPRMEDFRDLWANFKYFLYFGPRPPADRWTYWEKFDYFAVFWGIVVIGLSGLMLWFPGILARFFPGWWLNAAFVVHSDEALLAVGFIFIFHFFHTHLRPESFPMDPVIFTGTMPLARLKEERPLEYQRLMESGELEKLIADPPPPKQLRKVYFFGSIAVSLGVLLIVAILLALLFY